jgi:hypothetical protein
METGEESTKKLCDENVLQWRKNISLRNWAICAKFAAFADLTGCGLISV